MHSNIKEPKVLDGRYFSHEVFKELKSLADFYKHLSFHVIGFISLTVGTGGIINIDSYVYSSTQGTLNSIKSCLKKGRVGDAYCLLRKYYDTAITNIYINLYYADNKSLEKIVVDKVKNWVQAKEKLPETREVMQYVKEHKTLVEVNKIIYADSSYKEMRDRVNDFIHNNFFYHVLVNDGEILLEDRIKMLDLLLADLKRIYNLHLSYILFACPHYAIASNYIDALEMGMTPEEGSENFVASFIAKAFQNKLNKANPSLGKLILEKSGLDFGDYSVSVNS